jgi:inorganic pyrophosphatase
LEYPLFPGVGVKVRAVGMLVMEDDGGVDEKVLCVPVKDPRWKHIQDLDDVPAQIKNEIEHFFTHYKDLEPGKWVKIDGWKDKAATQKVIDAAYANYKH